MPPLASILATRPGDLLHPMLAFNVGILIRAHRSTAFAVRARFSGRKARTASFKLFFSNRTPSSPSISREFEGLLLYQRSVPAPDAPECRLKLAVRWQYVSVFSAPGMISLIPVVRDAPAYLLLAPPKPFNHPRPSPYFQLRASDAFPASCDDCLRVTKRLNRSRVPRGFVRAGTFFVLLILQTVQRRERPGSATARQPPSHGKVPHPAPKRWETGTMTPNRNFRNSSVFPHCRPPYQGGPGEAAGSAPPPWPTASFPTPRWRAVAFLLGAAAEHPWAATWGCERNRAEQSHPWPCGECARRASWLWWLPGSVKRNWRRVRSRRFRGRDPGGGGGPGAPPHRGWRGWCW